MGAVQRSRRARGVRTPFDKPALSPEEDVHARHEPGRGSSVAHCSCHTGHHGDSSKMKRLPPGLRTRPHARSPARPDSRSPGGFGRQSGGRRRDSRSRRPTRRQTVSLPLTRRPGDHLRVGPKRGVREIDADQEPGPGRVGTERRTASDVDNHRSRRDCRFDDPRLLGITAAPDSRLGRPMLHHLVLVGKDTTRRGAPASPRFHRRSRRRTRNRSASSESRRRSRRSRRDSRTRQVTFDGARQGPSGRGRGERVPRRLTPATSGSR